MGGAFPLVMLPPKHVTGQRGAGTRSCRSQKAEMEAPAPRPWLQDRDQAKGFGEGHRTNPWQSQDKSSES